MRWTFTRLQSALIREEINKKAEIDRKMAPIEERKDELGSGISRRFRKTAEPHRGVDPRVPSKPGSITQ
jgi:hypothetical protein